MRCTHTADDMSHETSLVQFSPLSMQPAPPEEILQQTKKGLLVRCQLDVTKVSLQKMNEMYFSVSSTGTSGEEKFPNRI